MKKLIILLSLVIGISAIFSLIIISRDKLVGDTDDIIINYYVIILFVNISFFSIAYSILLLTGKLKVYFEHGFGELDKARANLFFQTSLSPFIFSTLYFLFIRSIAIGKIIASIALVFFTYDIYGNIKLIRKKREDRP